MEAAIDLEKGRARAELLEKIAASILPLAAAGEPIAILMMQCLSCTNADQRCSDCWRLVFRQGSSAAPPAAAGAQSPGAGN